jgi:hypothetical protein
MNKKNFQIFLFLLVIDLIYTRQQVHSNTLEENKTTDDQNSLELMKSLLENDQIQTESSLQANSDQQSADASDEVITLPEESENEQIELDQEIKSDVDSTKEDLGLLKQSETITSATEANDDSHNENESTIDTSISEEDPFEEKNQDLNEKQGISIKKESLTNFKNHTAKLHELTGEIHNRMAKLGEDEKGDKYNELREKLTRVSEIYKKKYPSCLPLPTYLVENKTSTELKESEETQQCRYAYFLGYNVVVNWIQIVHPVGLTKEEAWKRIEKESLPAHLLDFNSENKSDRVINFKLSGKCFAKGMRSSLIRNCEKDIKGKEINSLENPQVNLKLRMEEMKNLIDQITRNI